MYNRVILIGRTTSDVEVKYTATQKAVGQVSLAVNRSYKNANGERDTDFFRLVIWGEQAVRFADWIKKGYMVHVEGELRSRSYDNEQGQRQFITEVIVQRFMSLEQRRDTNPNQDFLGGQDIGISDSELPF